MKIKTASRSGRWWILGAVLAGVMAAGAAEGVEPVQSIHEFTMTDIDGREVALSDYREQVLLVVNVASKCGFTRQYAGLEKLYQAYKDRGFAVLGFPANNFMGQEPGTEAEIKSFCTLTYGVTFPMFAKISVKGKTSHPLYAFLTDKKLHPEHGGAISWNFNKFLIGKDGRVLGRYGSRTEPDDPDLAAAIAAALTVPAP